MKTDHLSLFRFLLISIIFTSFSNNTFSQWKPINPKPFVDDCFVISADLNRCNVVTYRGNLVTSLDGGDTWEYNYTENLMNIKQTYFLNQNYGWAASGLGISKTTDGGNNWRNVGDSLEFANWDFFFSDSLNGWSVGNMFVKSSTDGGENWNTYTFPDNPQLNFISQYNDSVLFTGGSDLFRSTNGGYTWDTLPDPLNFYSYNNFLSIETDSVTLGLLVGAFNKVARTIDGGNNWELSFPNNSQSIITDLDYKYGLILTCGADKVFKSSNLGITWDSVTVPNMDYLEIYFATESIIYISGRNGALIKSTDRGNSFFPLDENLFGNNNMGAPSISSTDSLNAYLAADWTFPKVYRTSDGGESFVDISPSGIIDYVHKVYAVTDKMAVAASGIKIFTTKDGGENWNVSSYGPANTHVPNDFYFKDTLNGIAGCSWNLMRETTNGGDTWTNRILGTGQQHIYSISFPEPEYGFYSTQDRLYRTTNGGTDWLLVRSIELGKVKFIDRMTGVTFRGTSILRTTDGGMNWLSGEPVEYYSDFDIKKNGEGSVLLLLAYDSLYTSYDLGLTFSSEVIPFDDFRLINMVNPATAWLSGFYGKMVQYHNPSIPVNVESCYEQVNNFNLLQNYPNPFNPSTNITYKVAETDKVSLKIYNILGQEIKTLFEGENNPGIYTVKWNGSNNFGNKVGSGIYLCRIIAGINIRTIKMLLLE